MQCSRFSDSDQIDKDSSRLTDFHNCAKQCRQLNSKAVDMTDKELLVVYGKIVINALGLPTDGSDMFGYAIYLK